MPSALLGCGAAVLGAALGALAAVVLKVGANTGCLDVLPPRMAAACAVPTAAPWAVAAAAIAGALLGVGAVLLLARARVR